MPLQSQLVPIVLASGLDTKSDDRVTALGRLTILENGVFTAPGRINKRHGYRALGKTIESTGASITSAVGLLNFGDELLLADGQRLYSYSEATGHWIDRGALVPMRVSSTSVIRDSHTQSDPDSAVNRNVRVTAWTDSRGGIRYAAQDAISNAFFVQDGVIDVTPDANAYAHSPRVVAFGADLVVVWAKLGKLWYVRIPAARPTTIGTPVNFIASLSGGVFDVLVIGAKLFVAWQDTTGPVARVSYLSPSYSLATSQSLGHSGANAIGLCATDVQECVVMIASDIVAARVYSYALTAVTALKTLETIANVEQVTGAVIPGTRTLTAYYGIADLSNHPDRRYIRTNTLGIDSGTVGTAKDFIRSVSLSSRAFVSSGHTYVTTNFESQLQATFFVLDETAAVIAKIHPHTAGGNRIKSSLANVNVNGATREIACTQQTELIAQNGILTAFKGVTIGAIEFETSGPESAKSNANLLLAGGVVQAYDGVTVTEAGYHVFPEGITLNDGAALAIVVTTDGDASHAEVTTFTFAGTGRIAAGQYFELDSTTTALYVWFVVDGLGTDPAPGGRTGIKVTVTSDESSINVAHDVAIAINAAAHDVTAVAVGSVVTTTNSFNGAVPDATNAASPDGVGTGSVDGAVQYTAIYEWTDNAGQLVRSVPSVPASINVSGPASVTIAIPALRLTARDGTRRAPVRIVVYRTQDSQPIPYRVTSVTNPPLNDITKDTIYVIDTLADSAIAGNDLLYTFGGLLENDPPPAADTLVTWKNRMVVAGGEDRNTISVSQQSSAGDSQALRFSDDFAFSIDQRGGDITALGVLDDKLIVFKRQMIFAMDGEGPNNAGQGGSFSVASLIATDVGCANPRSVVLTENGLMFQSTAGIYLLDRSLQVNYVGAAVEKFNDFTATGAEFVPGSFQIRFTTTGDNALVYDLVVQQWSTFTNHTSVGCTVANDTFSFARPDGTVWREDDTSFVDGDGELVRLRLETGWISMAGIQGFQRARRLLVLGDYKGPHQLVMQIATDYSPAFAQYEVADAAPLVGASVYGTPSPYGAGSVYGGEFVPYQFRVHIVHQKCQAIRIRIEDAQTSAYNEGYSINALTLEIGAKRGAMKVPAARSF